MPENDGVRSRPIEPTLPRIVFSVLIGATLSFVLHGIFVPAVASDACISFVGAVITAAALL